MSLFKKFQLKANNQTKTSFKYIVLTSINTLKLNSRLLNFPRTSNVFSLCNQRIFLDLRQIFQHLNLKNLFKVESGISKRIKVVRSPAIIATFFRQNLNSNLKNIMVQTSDVTKSSSRKFLDLNKIMNLKTKAFVQLFLSLYKNFLLKIQSFKLKFELFSFFNRKNFASLSAMGGLFTWEEYKLSDSDIKHEVNEMMNLFDVYPEKENAQEAIGSPHKVTIDFEAARFIENQEWKLIYDKKDLMIWRRCIQLENDDDVQENSEKSKESKPNYDLFEYKVLGRFNDITPLEFYETQIDLEYRKEWDYLAVSLDVISKDPITSTELVQWIMKFPYPLNPREYIYIRRYCIDPKAKILILVSKSVPKVKIDPCLIDSAESLDPTDSEQQSKIIDNFLDNQNENKYVRVTKYESNIIIFPHDDFDKPGLYYVIQYYDINKAKIPKIAYKWMATSGLPDYLEKVHKAALKLKEKNESERVNEGSSLMKYGKINLNEEFEVEEWEDLSSEVIENTNSSAGEKDKASDLNEVETGIVEKTDDANNHVLSKKKLKFVFFDEQLLDEFFSQHGPHSVFNN